MAFQQCDKECSSCSLPFLSESSFGIMEKNKWRKKSALFIAWKQTFYKSIEKWGPCAAFWSVWKKTAWLTASKLDHTFSGWWQHLRAHPKGKDLNKLHFNILGSFIPAEITQKQRNTHTRKSNRPKGLGNGAVHGAKVTATVKLSLCVCSRGYILINTRYHSDGVCPSWIKKGMMDLRTKLCLMKCSCC